MMKKINILYVTHSPIIGGAELSLLNHLRYINKTKFNVYLVGSSLIKEQAQEIPNITFIEMEFFLLFRASPLVLINFWKMVSNLMKIIKKYEIDIVHTNSVKAHYIGSAACLLIQTKLIWWMRDTTFNKYLFPILKNIPAQIVCVSKYIQVYYGIPNNSLVIYNGSNIYKLKYRPKKSSHKFVIGCVERLVRWKGVQNLIQAFVPIAKKYPKATLLIVGSGKDQAEDIENELKEMVKHLNLETQVKFLGFRIDAPKIIRLFDVLVHPPIEPEPFGLVVVEAMMSKVLVVCSNLGGPAEFIHDRQTGMLYNKGNILELTSILQQVIRGEIDKNGMVNRAFKYALSNLTQQIETQKIEQLYLSFAD